MNAGKLYRQELGQQTGSFSYCPLETARKAPEARPNPECFNTIQDFRNTVLGPMRTRII